MAPPYVQMIDATWLLHQRAQALKEWACLEFLHQHATDQLMQLATNFMILVERRASIH
jgi:hypothetical protein